MWGNWINVFENKAYIAATKIMISAKSKDNLFELSTIFNCHHQEMVTTNKEDHVYTYISVQRRRRKKERKKEREKERKKERKKEKTAG